MICHRCGKSMYFAPLGNRWYHDNLNTLCPVSWPCVQMTYTYTFATNTNLT